MGSGSGWGDKDRIRDWKSGKKEGGDGEDCKLGMNECSEDWAGDWTKVVEYFSF